jgi:hypothetical protein
LPCSFVFNLLTVLFVIMPGMSDFCTATSYWYLPRNKWNSSCRSRRLATFPPWSCWEYFLKYYITAFVNRESAVNHQAEWVFPWSDVHPSAQYVSTPYQAVGYGSRRGVPKGVCWGELSYMELNSSTQKVFIEYFIWHC